MNGMRDRGLSSGADRMVDDAPCSMTYGWDSMLTVRVQ